MAKKRKPALHPSEYLIPASDSRGHSAMYQFRAPEEWGRRMEELVISRRFPFGSPSDILRWCWFEGMNQLAHLEPECTDLSQVTAALRVVRDVEDQQRFASLFDRVTKIVDKATGEKDEATARQLIADLRYQFELMPDGRMREKYLERLKKYDWLLNVAGVAPAELAPPKKARRPKFQLEDEA